MKEPDLRIPIDGEEFMDESSIYVTTLPRVNTVVQNIIAQPLDDVGRVGEHPDLSENRK